MVPEGEPVSVADGVIKAGGAASHADEEITVIEEGGTGFDGIHMNGAAGDGEGRT